MNAKLWRKHRDSEKSLRNSCRNLTLPWHPNKGSMGLICFFFPLRNPLYLKLLLERCLEQHCPGAQVLTASSWGTPLLKSHWESGLPQVAKRTLWSPRTHTHTPLPPFHVVRAVPPAFGPKAKPKDTEAQCLLAPPVVPFSDPHARMAVAVPGLTHSSRPAQAARQVFLKRSPSGHFQAQKSLGPWFLMNEVNILAWH